MKILETFTKYQILTPSFFSTNPRSGVDQTIPHSTSKLWWYYCRLRFWRYKMNYEMGFLVKKNKWTREWHLTKNWEGFEVDHFGSAMGIFKKIAGI